jgi:choline dehydrogenase-like flavoprotein
MEALKMTIYQYDYVIVGGGSAGAALASRLSENPKITVGLFEAGGEANTILHRAPMAVVALMPKKNEHNWAFNTAPQKGLNGRVGYQPRGRGLGGSSAINAMAYVRGHKNDFNHWESLGNPGWGYKDVLPYFMRSENNETLGAPYHGRSGPLHISEGRSDNPFTQKFIDAGQEAGHKFNADINGEEQEGICRFQVNMVNGERCSTGRAFILPFLGRRKNLHVIQHAHVKKILIENGADIGIEFQQDKKVLIAHAKREVIISAGTFQSPQLLMLSGIGDPKILQDAGIEVKLALPGVGKNLQDHIDFIFVSKLNNLDLAGLSLGGGLHLIKEIKKWRATRRGFVATNYAEAGAFLKTKPELTAPDIQLHFILARVEDHGRKISMGHGFSTHVACLRPKSRGTVSINSLDANAPPVIDPNFFDHPDDMATLISGFKIARNILNQKSIAGLKPTDINTANVSSDSEIEAAIRSSADTLYHPVGTCKMGSDDMAVVDSNLRVRGINNLRVVDASIMPTIVGGNTNAAAIMIGEKAADLILNN